jgi:2-polyprenyl-3-methyl-5-hydroxy-6-metoxy-1,4-benzoquinol methylase
MPSHNNCKLCGSTTFERLGKIRTTRTILAKKILECTACSFVFLNDDSHISSNHYENSKMHDYEQTLEASRIATYVDDFRRYSMLKSEIAEKNILEVGSGNGGFLKLAKDVANSVHGIEPEIKHHDVLLLEELNINSFDFYMQQKIKFDTIFSFHVIEHVSDPFSFFMQLLELLKVNGKAYIETPNSNDALIKLYNSEAFQDFTYWDNHLVLFNNKSFEYMCSKLSNISYKSITVQRYGIANHLYWLSNGKPGGHKFWSFLENESINVQYKEKLSELFMNDTLFYEIIKTAE